MFGWGLPQPTARLLIPSRLVQSVQHQVSNKTRHYWHSCKASVLPKFQWRCGLFHWVKPKDLKCCAIFRRLLSCLLYTSDAADDLTRVDLGGRRIIKKKKK